MIAAGDHVPKTQDVLESYRGRVLAEIEAADQLLPGSKKSYSVGDLNASTLLVKGTPGPAESAGADVLSGPDGDAAAKALDALHLSEGGVFRVLSRSSEGEDPVSVSKRLRWIIEAVDPSTVIALDSVAGKDLAAAFNITSFEIGTVKRSLGRRLLAVDGFEASLADEAKKRVVWQQLKTLADADSLDR